MIESMLLDEELRVLRLARKLEKLKAQMSKIEGSNRTAYRLTRNEYDSTRSALNKALSVAESYSPGCSAGLLALAKKYYWK